MDLFDTGAFPMVIAHCLNKEDVAFLEVTVTL
jgi:hypothetical protein